VFKRRDLGSKSPKRTEEQVYAMTCDWGGLWSVNMGLTQVHDCDGDADDFFILVEGGLEGDGEELVGVTGNCGGFGNGDSGNGLAARALLKVGWKASNASERASATVRPMRSSGAVSWKLAGR
jgi:hypothetical protein